jgi:hypothetical protein
MNARRRRTVTLPKPRSREEINKRLLKKYERRMVCCTTIEGCVVRGKVFVLQQANETQEIIILLSRSIEHENINPLIVYKNFDTSMMKVKSEKDIRFLTEAEILGMKL